VAGGVVVDQIAAERAPPSLNAQSIDRIIAAVGLEPDDLNRDELLFEIDLVADFYRAHISLHSKEGQRLRQRSAAAIARHAGELLRHLDAADDELRARIRDPLRRGLAAQGFNQVIAGLHDLKAIAEYEADPPSPPDQIDATPLKYLITITLADVYEQHFRKRPGRSRSRDGSTIYGPYVRFVRAVLAEIGESASPETIDTYLK
jgi:hypothetical protein